jgi:predicted transcriptional regulator
MAAKREQKVSARLDDDLHQRLVSLAAELDIPVSQIVRSAVREYVERAGK